MSKDFTEQLEHELRAASARRVRLALARVPRAPAGIAPLVFAMAICAAVAIPLLQTRTRSPEQNAPPGGHRSAAGSVVRTCADTISGQLPARWHTQRHGTVIAGPITFANVLENGSVYPSHFFEGLAVVRPGRAVTVSIPPYERDRVALDYTSVAPRKRFYLSQGTRSVTFHPCPGPAGQTQFDGGFIVSRPQCAVINIQTAGDAGVIQGFLPFGRSCWAAMHPPPVLTAARVLKGDGIGQATFGEAPQAVARQLKALLGRAPSRPYHSAGACQIDHEIDWPGLNLYFDSRRFAGYAYWEHHGGEPVLATAGGLLIGDTVKAGRRLYGANKFRVSAYQGGAWFVSTPSGRIEGFTSKITNPNGTIRSIEAGDVGCPAMAP